MTELSRRTALGLIPAGIGLAACGGASASTNPAQIVRDLTVARPGQRAAAAGFVVMRAGIILASQYYGYSSGLSAQEKEAGIKRRPFSLHSPFRAASVSKLATAMIGAVLQNEGDLDFDADISTILPNLPRHPRYPDIAITMRMLLSHTAGMKDPEAYWVTHPGSIDALYTPDLYNLDRVPGRDFEYCNLGYGIAATAFEVATGQRFDELFFNIFNPIPMDAGFNWSRVGTLQRSRGTTLYRETAEGWQVQTDGPETLLRLEPSSLIEDGASVSTYTPGQNGTLFSPQGGLRASLIDLAQIAQLFTNSPQLTDPVWTLNEDASNGVHDQRYFTQFGTGVHIHPADESPWPGQTMWGHHGEAYGLYAGAWYLPHLNISVSYAVTGTPETPPSRSEVHPALNTFTEPLLRAARLAYEKKR
jgi:CubicO group peptidase (beta-lactamase class C family)